MSALTFPQWLSELRSLFPVADEYALAAAIYSFFADFENGLTPQESYTAFDQFVSAEDAA